MYTKETERLMRAWDVEDTLWFAQDLAAHRRIPRSWIQMADVKLKAGRVPQAVTQALMSLSRQGKDAADRHLAHGAFHRQEMRIECYLEDLKTGAVS